MAYRRHRRSRGYSRARRSFRSAGYKARGKGGMGSFQMRWGIGAAAGIFAPRVHAMQDMLITAIAVAPVRIPYGIKSLAQGYVGGMLVKPFIGGFAQVGSNGSSGNEV